MEILIEFPTGTPKRVQLERQLRDAIRSGRLPPGTRLPPSRQFAEDLGVSRGVVVEAYAQLTAEGYLLSRPRAGTQVRDVGRRARTQDAAPGHQLPRVRYELRSGAPDPAAFPRRAWISATGRALRELPDADLLGPIGGGHAALRTAISEYLARARDAVATPDRIIVTAGLAHGLVLLLSVLRSRGTHRVAVENPSWPHHARAVREAGLIPVPVEVDQRGLRVDQLDRLRVDAVLTTPAHQFPTGVVLAPERRIALIEWARGCHGLVIEDDYDAEFRYDREPVAALQGLAPDRVAYGGTVSKTLSPTLRIGWLLVPPALAPEVARRSHASGAWPSVIDQAALATLIQRGDLERHLRALRRRYRSRRDSLAGALERTFDIQVTGVAAGLHLLARPKQPIDTAQLVSQARERGVAIDSLHERCWVKGSVEPALLLGYAATPEASLRRAVEIMAELPSTRPMLRLA